MTSESVTAVIVMERTSGLSIRNECSSIYPKLLNVNKRAKVMLRNADLIMQTQNHNVMTGL